MWNGGTALVLVVAGHAPGLESGAVVGALLRGEDGLALGALEVGISGDYVWIMGQ